MDRNELTCSLATSGGPTVLMEYVQLLLSMDMGTWLAWIVYPSCTENRSNCESSTGHAVCIRHFPLSLWKCPRWKGALIFPGTCNISRCALQCLSRISVASCNTNWGQVQRHLQLQLLRIFQILKNVLHNWHFVTFRLWRILMIIRRRRRRKWLADTTRKQMVTKKEGRGRRELYLTCQSFCLIYMLSNFIHECRVWRHFLVSWG